MNWKKQRELRRQQIEEDRIKDKELAKKGWSLMGKVEREQLRKLVQHNWDKIPGFIKRTMDKDKYFKLEYENYCIKKMKK